MLDRPSYILCLVKVIPYCINLFFMAFCSPEVAFGRCGKLLCWYFSVSGRSFA